MGSSSRQVGASERSDNGSGRQERPASSPCPSSSSSSSEASSSSASSSSSSSDSSASSNSSNDSDDEPPPPTNNSNGGQGGGNGKKKDEDDEDDGNSSDSSSSSDSSAASADESDLEEDDGVMLDTDDEKDKIKSLSTKHDGFSPTDEDEGESDGSSDLENAYPRLPSAPVDALIAFRRQAAHEELQLSDELKRQVVADAKQRQQERRELAQRAKKKKNTPQSLKRRHSKQEEFVANGAARHHSTNGSTGTGSLKMMPSNQQEMTEDEWMVDCSCGLREKNYDDGTSMIQCDSCSHWVHAKCADKLPETVAQEKFLCFRCSWIFDCVCAVRRRPNHDDGQRMVECESCKTWQHTLCVGIPMTEEPPDDYRCPRCVKKTRRRNSATIASPSRQRQRKRRHTEPTLHHRKNSDASPVVAVNVRTQARPVSAVAAITASNGTRSSRPRQSTEKKGLTSTAPSPPPVPAASPPSTPPPPPSTPPPLSAAPPHAIPGLRKHDHGHLKRQSDKSGERSPPSKSSPHRKRGRPLGSDSSSSKKAQAHLEDDDLDHPSTAPATVTPPSRGKGLMLRGFSASPSGSNGPSSSSVVVRPPLPLTPPSGGATSSGHSQSSPRNHGRGLGRKRKGSSARDRLAKKLKIRKSSLR